MKILVLSLLFTCVFFSTAGAGTNPAALAAKVSGAKQVEEFPRLISYYDLVALSPEDRTAYLEQLRNLMGELAQMQSKAGAANVVANPNSLWRDVDLAAKTLFTPAYADIADPASVDQSCSDGGTRSVCVTNFAGSQEQCLCEISKESLLDNYGTPSPSPSGCDVSSDPEAQLDIKENYQTVYIGGSARCVTAASYKSMATVMPPDLYSSFSRAVTDPARSKIFKADKSSRYIDLSKSSQAFSQNGKMNDPFSGQVSDHFMRTDGPAQDARVSAQVAVDDAARAKDMSTLLKSKDADVASTAESKTLADVTEAKTAADLADQKTKDAVKGATDSINDASAAPPGDGAAKTMTATAQTVSAGSSAGIVGADLKKAGADLTKVDGNTPSTPDMVPLKKEDEKDAADLKKTGQEVLDAGAALITKAQDLLHAKSDELSAAGAKLELAPLQTDLTKLRDAVAKGDIDAIERATTAARGKIEDTRDALNLPSDDPAHEPGTVTCLKTGTFTCANRKNKKTDTPQMIAARAAYLATSGDKKCIFAGNSSEFDKDAVGRNGKTRLGCQAVTEFSFDGDGKSQKISCAAPKSSSEKPVLCNPMLYGFDRDSSGVLSGHCVDWNSTATASCNYKYPLQGPRGSHKGATGAVSPSDFLTTAGNKLEPQWTKLADAISRQCNTKEFRSLNCNECELIALRLSAMKAYATKDTCTWPSELSEIRNGMKSGASGGATTK